VGTVLARAFYQKGIQVTVLSRAPIVAPWKVVRWDVSRPATWAAELEGADAIINLAGRSVNCRYTPANRAAIMQSRIESVRAVGAAINCCSHPPKAWLQASTATIYAHRFDAPNDERTGIIGGREANAPSTWRFSIDVATAWERALDEAEVPNTRKVKLRSAMIMSPDRGGIFDTLLGLVRRGLGGASGDGRQFVSWVHDLDFVKAVLWIIEHENMHGAVNIAAPNPLPNAEFMTALRKCLGYPIRIACDQVDAGDRSYHIADGD